MKKLHMEYLSVRNSNWKILLDLLYVLPLFVLALKIVETYDDEILGRIDEFRGKGFLISVGRVFVFEIRIRLDQSSSS
jgi:hypothetical protein